MYGEKFVEIKYPSTHGLDGKIHKIVISRAVRLSNGNYYVEGFEADDHSKSKVVLELGYSESDRKWYIIPHNNLGYAKLAIEADSIVMRKALTGKKSNDTDFLRDTLNGMAITNTEEKDYELPAIPLAAILIGHRRLLNSILSKVKSIDSEIFTESMLDDFKNIYDYIIGSVYKCFTDIMNKRFDQAKSSYQTTLEEVKFNRLG
jgi:hypothetical protein